MREREGESQKNRRTSHAESPFAYLSSREEAVSGAIAPEHHAGTTSGSADRGSAALVRRPAGQGGKRRRSTGLRPVAPQRSAARGRLGARATGLDAGRQDRPG